MSLIPQIHTLDVHTRRSTSLIDCNLKQIYPIRDYVASKTDSLLVFTDISPTGSFAPTSPFYNLEFSPLGSVRLANASNTSQSNRNPSTAPHDMVVPTDAEYEIRVRPSSQRELQDMRAAMRLRRVELDV